MTTTLDDFARWLEAPEGEHLEFKEAKGNYDFERLVKYCCAIANERGGRIVLGVTDRRPRRVVGTAAFEDLERTKAGLTGRLHLRVDADVLDHPDGRVVVFNVPSRPVGMPIQVAGAYWMRAGEDLVPMTQDLLKRIFDEAQPDFSAQVCPGAGLEDLDPEAVAEFRKRWAIKSRMAGLAGVAAERLLEDAELVVGGDVTYAALVLLGKQQSLGRHLAQAEVVFEFRADEASIAYQQRKEYRKGFLLYHDDLWDTIALRNTVHSYQDGLFRMEVPTFNESAVREAVLNAICHRDYRMAGSVFVKQWPTQIEFTSPGGFPPEITPENILFRQSPRNRRIAEALAKCGFVERSGQGADRMFETSLREGKLPPDYSRSDPYHVHLRLNGRVQDEAFLRFLDRLANHAQRSFTVDDMLVLDAVHRGLNVPSELRGRVQPLVDLGALERVARNKLVLAKRFYALKGKQGEYTRRKGLDRETQKALLLRHINENARDGSTLGVLCQVLPGLEATQVQNLLRELKNEGHVHPIGRTRGARWYPGAGPADESGE